MFNFGAHLKMLRKEKGLTQKKLANLLGLTERGIQKYELGEQKPKFEAIIALSKALQITSDELLGLNLK